MEEEPEEVEMGDVEVEGASGSSRNYEEPFVPEFAMMNFKEVGIGRLLKSVPIWAGDEDWEIRDEEERRQVRAVMIIEDERKCTLSICFRVHVPFCQHNLINLTDRHTPVRRRRLDASVPSTETSRSSLKIKPHQRRSIHSTLA